MFELNEHESGEPYGMVWWYTVEHNSSSVYKAVWASKTQVCPNKIVHYGTLHLINMLWPMLNQDSGKIYIYFFDNKEFNRLGLNIDHWASVYKILTNS